MIAIVPAEMALDSRLTKMQLRVLIALLTFRAKNTDTVWPKRETLSKRCGYHINNISKITKQLVELGWLEKVGKGGFSKSSQYRITVPESLTTLTEPVTLTETVTVTEPVSTTLTEPVTKPSPNRLGAKNKPRTNQGTNHKSEALSLGISEELWDEYIKTRKRVGATNTPLALTTLINKIKNLCEGGYSAYQLVEIANESGWKSVYPPKAEQRGREVGPRSMRGIQ